MKIALLTTARSGSTSLFYLIKSHLKKDNSDYVCVTEPFNNKWRDYMGHKKFMQSDFINKTNIFIKTFVNQIPIDVVNENEEYWNWFITYFDKIILLDRKDKQLQSESLKYHEKQKNPKSWHIKQYYDLSNITENEIEITKNKLINEVDRLYKFSNLGYPIFYYEDIFIKKDKIKIKEMFNYINLKLDDMLYEKHIKSDNGRIRLTKDELVKKLI
jgi:hypothetical protein